MMIVFIYKYMRLLTHLSRLGMGICGMTWVVW